MENGAAGETRPGMNSAGEVPGAHVAAAETSVTCEARGVAATVSATPVAAALLRPQRNSQAKGERRDGGQAWHTEVL